MNCRECGTPTKNPKFCSRSCSTKSTNRLVPKRKSAEWHCRQCGALNRGFRLSKLCKDCTRDNAQTIKKRTLKEFYGRADSALAGKHPSWRNAAVRNFNRIWNADKRLEGCRECGYKLHVELAHIKALSSFPETATLGEVNHPSNIVPLCPNHHWEFDNGHLKIGTG